MLTFGIVTNNNPISRAETRRLLRQELREKELEGKWKSGNISKMEAIELISTKVLKTLEGDSLIIH